MLWVGASFLLSSKDRLTLLSPSLVDDLVWLIGDRGLDEPLIPSQRGGALSKRSVQHVMTRARSRAGLRIHVTCHSLRHAFATPRARRASLGGRKRGMF